MTVDPVINTSVSFYAWMVKQRLRTDVIGDLAKDIAKDKTFPRRARRLHVLLHYYRFHPINRELVRLAHAEWRVLRRRLHNPGNAA